MVERLRLIQSLKPYPHGADLDVALNTRNLRSERVCFEALMDIYPSLRPQHLSSDRWFAIGPNILNQALGLNPDFAILHRPDGLIIDGDTLTHISESKQRKTNGVYAKKIGISALMNRLRLDRNLLPDLINSLCPDLDLPLVQIPPDGAIDFSVIVGGRLHSVTKLSQPHCFVSS